VVVVVMMMMMMMELKVNNNLEDYGAFGSRGLNC
jgi:hypothetical protein